MDGSRKKINSRSPTKYAPVELCDDVVYDYAQHYYTIQEIADRFNITASTLLALHGDAFHAGKDAAFTKPRMALAKIINDFLNPDPVTGEPVNFARQDVPVGTLLKAIELHAKKYEGLGSKTEVHHTGNVNGYDAVESQPQIIERPSDD